MTEGASRPVTLSSRDGLALEAAFDGPPDPKAALLLCHPHPKMGGTMDAPLLLAVRDELLAHDWAVLRFNFRGIGASEGEPGTGIDEVSDAGGGLDWLRTNYEQMPRAVAGWSFGAGVAMKLAMKEPDLLACVAIAPSAERKPDVTEGLPSPANVPRDLKLLVVIGARDDVVDSGAGARWARAAGAEYRAMPGANHFFWAKYESLATEVTEWLDAAL